MVPLGTDWEDFVILIVPKTVWPTRITSINTTCKLDQEIFCGQVDSEPEGMGFISTQTLPRGEEAFSPEYGEMIPEVHYGFNFRRVTEPKRFTRHGNAIGPYR
jgi:hypothetical protein